MTEPKQAAFGKIAQFRVKGRRCPICKQPAVVAFSPFCSKRCGQIDLGRWLGEAYRAPASDEGWSESDVWFEDRDREDRS